MFSPSDSTVIQETTPRHGEAECTFNGFAHPAVAILARHVA